VGLRFDPVGGGQFKQALKTIIEAESQPIKTLETRKKREEEKLKLFQDFKSKFTTIETAINEIANFNKFRELKVDLGDGQNLISVTIDKEKAQPGSYELKIEELAQRSSVISSGFKNPDEPILGMGFVVVDTPDGKLDIFVDDSASSLNGIARAINNEKHSPISAAVVRDASQPDEPWRMILKGKKDGNEHDFSFPEFYFMDRNVDFYFDDDREAKNAFVSIDGFPLELDTNDIVDFLPGVNVHLRQARPEQPFFITITEDPQKISGKMKGTVDGLNQVLKFVNDQNKVDEKTDTRNTFAGDTLLQGIEYRLRNLLHEGFPVFDNPEDPEKYRLVFLNQIGVEFDKTGMIGFKEEKFTKALEKDFRGVSEAITGPEWGFATQARQVMRDYMAMGTGSLATREKSLRERINSVDKQIDYKTRALERRQQALTDKFSRLQGTLSNLQQQQSYLASALPSSGGGNLIQQLLGG